MRCTALLLAIGLCACLGTEGGNPGDPMDGGSRDGGGYRDSGPSADSGPWRDAGPGSKDAGVHDAGCGVTGAAPICDPTATACACAVGPAREVATGPAGDGHRLVLRGPTSAGGLVALHETLCAAGCSDTARHDLRVHRFDGSGAEIGSAIEVTRSALWPSFGAVLEGDVLAIAWPDERAGPSGIADVWFARLDVATGAWLTAPRRVLTPELPLFEVTMVRGASDWAIVWSAGPTDPPIDPGGIDAGPRPAPGLWLVRAGDDGVPIGTPRRLDVPPDGTTIGALARQGDGYAMLGSREGALRFDALNADGSSAGAPVPIATYPASSPHLRPLPGGGLLAAWSDGTTGHLARLDASGAPMRDDPVVVGSIDDLVLDPDGSVWALWTPLDPCRLRPAEAVLAHFGAGATRLHDDLLLARGDLQSSRSLARTATALHAALTYWTPTSAAVIVPACAAP